MLAGWTGTRERIDVDEALVDLPCAATDLVE